MTKIISARIADGQILPTEPLPAADQIEKVSIVVRLKSDRPPGAPSIVEELAGILKDTGGDWREEVTEHLKEKHR